MISPVLALALCAGLAPSMAWAQDGQTPMPNNGRRVLEGPPTTLSFRDASIEDLVPFLVEATGKVVIVPEMRLPARITVVSDKPVSRYRALDLVILALQQDGVAVVETEDIIILRDINEVTRQDVPVIGPNQSVLGRTDVGAMAQKVYRIRNSQAKALADSMKDILPEYAKVTIDEASNHLAVLGSIGLLQRVEALIAGLDQPGSRALVTRTFRLRYADAELISRNITDLFGQSNNTTQRNQQQNRGNQFNRFFGQGQGQNESEGASTAELRVTANTQQNAVTVAAEAGVLDQIADLIDREWDLPLPEETVTPRIYTLENSDPVAVRDLLVGLFGQPSTGTTGGGQPGQGGGQGGQGSSGTSQGAGRLAGQFAFEAIPSAGQVAVVAKSPDNLKVIDDLIRELDRPKNVGLPAIVSLKHVSSEELAEQLNALLSLDGTLASIPRSESGLTSGAGAGQSPFASDATTTADAAENDPGTITFWWQTAREQTTNAGPSNLIGKLRIVPVWRQNAVMVLSPPEYRNAVVELIQELDKPGRQVLIQAVIAEVSRDDAQALGLRWSSSAINLGRTDNAISFTSSATGTENNIFGNLFDTSVLNVGVDLNAVLQALDERTNVNILSRPIIFTSDNQEAEFFDGQDIPFITNAQTTDTGGTTQGFEYRAVGIQLRVRPRLTPNKDVDLRVNIELSSVAPGQANASGQVVVDRRETTTQLIIRSGQTLVISGILRNEDSQVVRKVPLLGDIPLLGWLFRSRETGVSSTEQLIFITPVVVENGDEADALNEAYRLRLRMQREQMGIDEPLEGPAPIGPPTQPQEGDRESDGG